MSLSSYLFTLGVFLLLASGACDVCSLACEAYVPGDILIGVINAYHGKVEGLIERLQPEGFTCTDFILQSFVETLAVIHTINVINDFGFLPGIRLGYVICDDCCYPAKALDATEHLMSTNKTSLIECDSADHPTVKAVIGARFSEVSITVARLLAIYMVPQISTSSSAAILDDKLRFPSFLRTVPSDVHQTKALVRLMTYFKWDWIGIVSGDDDYGKAALQSLLLDAAVENICVGFQEVIPQYLNQPNSQNIISLVAEKIRSSKAQVVLLILKEELVMKLFNEMLRTNTTRIWVASDAWSMSQPVATMPGINNVGEIFGFSFITGQIPGFSQFLQNLQPTPGSVNHFIEEYKNLRFACTPELMEYRKCLTSNPPYLCPMPASLSFKSPEACSLPDPQKANDDFLLQVVNINVTYSERLAVWSVAHALKNLLSCNDTVCQGDKDFPPWKLLGELKNISFTLDQQLFSFNENGSFSSGYDLINWERGGNYRYLRVVGRYNIRNTVIEIKNETIDPQTINNTVLSFKCLPTCPPGKANKVFNQSCCYECAECMEGTYSDRENQLICENCPKGTWSLKGWQRCVTRNETFFSWNDPYGIALLTFGVSGVSVLLVVLIIFIVGRDSPAVKVAGGRLCYVMIAGLAVSFVGVILFMLKPDDVICQTRQAMYGMGFTLCVSCILIKAFRTFLAFLFDLHWRHNLNKLYKPIGIIVMVTAAQGLICIFWLLFDSPKLESITSNQSMSIQLQCNEGSGVGFSIMLGYIGLLALICFLLAFKGRKVPHRFNETGYVIFSMLTYLFVWVCFIPIYVTKNQQRSAVQASAILVSNYGIIFCHFFPKCYMVLF